MSGEEATRNAPLIAAVILLGLLCAAGGYLLYTGWVPPQTVAESESAAMPETEPTAPQTTASATAKPVQTTVTTAAPDPHAPYLAYLEDTLIPESGSADTTAALPADGHTGIAGVFFADLRDTGADDMVVIRLDYTGESCAALPVLLWYGIEHDNVTLLDTFEVKPQWSAYCIRRDEKSLYLSGEYLGESGEADTWRFTEIELAFRPDPDLTMLNMVQGSLSDRPAPLYPDDAALLLEMQLDTALPVAPMKERRYILRDYTRDFS